MKSMTSAKSALSAAVVLLALGACAPGSSSDGEPAADPNAAVQTGVPSGQVELNLIATPESGAAMKYIIPAFQAKHPNVKINYVDTTYDDYNKSLNLALSSDTSPDIVLLNAVGTTVKDQLILNLQPYAKAYGWETAYPAGQLNQWRVAKDGTTLGSGATSSWQIRKKPLSPSTSRNTSLALGPKPPAIGIRVCARISA